MNQANKEQTVTTLTGTCVQSFTKPLDSGEYGVTLLHMEDDGTRSYYKAYHDCFIPKGYRVEFDNIDEGRGKSFNVIFSFTKPEEDKK